MPPRLFAVLLNIPLFSGLALAQEEENARESYVLRANDVIELSVYQEPDLNKKVTVLKTGEAGFPLIGSVKVGGKTLAEASEEIRQLYAADYLRYPRVNLAVTEYAVDFVKVLGRVGSPGDIPIPQIGTLDLRAALATAGGITELSDRNKIQLKTIDGKLRTLTYDYIQKEGGKIILKSGDQVVVNDSPYAGMLVSVVGEVNKPGVVKVPNDGKLDIATALAQAGGLAELADTQAISVVRSSGSNAVYSLAEIQRGRASKVRLSGGDRLVVAKSRFAEATVSVLGKVAKPGLVKFPLNGRLDLLTAIAMAGGTTEMANIKKVIINRPNNKPVAYNLEKLRGDGVKTVWLYPNDEIKVSERWF